MQKFTERKTFRFTKEQIETFSKLEDMNIDLSVFVRLAIKEKINRDYKNIKTEPKLNLVKIKDKYF